MTATVMTGWMRIRRKEATGCGGRREGGRGAEWEREKEDDETATMTDGDDGDA